MHNESYEHAVVRRWLPRQRVGAPMFICYGLVAAVGAGAALESGAWGQAIGILVAAVFLAALGWGLAAAIPSDEEITTERERLEKRIAKLQGRLP